MKKGKYNAYIEKGEKMEQSVPISIIMESAEKETREAIDHVKQKYNLRPCIMDVIVASVLADVRKEAKAELIGAADEIIGRKNEELEKAKAAAKKVLKAESEKESEPDTEQ